MTAASYTILLFHSVDNRERLSYRDLGNIHPDVFAGLLPALKKDYDIISLQDMVACISGKHSETDRFLSITFDDGPKSYAVHAAPAMASMGISSTCFLITDCIDDREIYWRYLYNYCVQRGQGKSLAALVSAESRTLVNEKNLISFTRSNFRRKNVERIMQGILDHIVPEEEYRLREQDLFLSSSDISGLKAGPLVQFGIHTRTHPVLMHLSEREIEEELAGSISFYRSFICNEIPMFSLPFGRLFKDYDERAVLSAMELSVKVVLSAYGGGNESGAPLYNLRRIPVNEEMLTGGYDRFRSLIESRSEVPEYHEHEQILINSVSSHLMKKMIVS